MQTLKRGTCNNHKGMTFVDVDNCPLCGSTLVMDEDSDSKNDIDIPVRFIVSICDSCGCSNDLDCDVCNNCGAEIEHDVQIKETAQGLRALILAELRNEILLLQRRTSTSVPGTVRVSDEQYLNALNRNNVFEKAKFDDVKLAVNKASECEGDKTELLNLLAVIPRRLTTISDVYESMGALAPIDGFKLGHPYLLSALRHLTNAIVVAFSILTATTYREANDCGRMLQQELDQAASDIERFGGSISQTKLPVNEIDLLNRRVKALVRASGDFVYRDRLNLASVAAQWINEAGDLDGMISQSTAYSSTLFENDPFEIPASDRIALVGIAAFIAAQPNPQAIIDSAKNILEVFRASYRLNEAAYSSLDEQFVCDIENGLHELYVSGEFIASTDFENLADSARRDLLIGIYHRLAEGSFRNLLNLPLYALFISRKKNKPYPDISKTGIAEKLEWISHGKNHKEMPFPPTETRLIRNAYAHMSLNTDTDEIQLRDFNPKTQETKEILITEDELQAHIERLIEISAGLVLATNVFILEQREVFSWVFTRPASREFINEAAITLLLGTKGLLRLVIGRDGSTLTVSADIPANVVSSDVNQLLSVFYAAAQLWPDVTQIVLKALADDDTHQETAIKIRTFSLNLFKTAGTDYRDLAIIRACLDTEFSGPFTDNKYIYTGDKAILTCAQLLIPSIQQIATVIMGQAEMDLSEYLQLLAITKRRFDYADDFLQTTDMSKSIGASWIEFHGAALTGISLANLCEGSILGVDRQTVASHLAKVFSAYSEMIKIGACGQKAD